MLGIFALINYNLHLSMYSYVTKSTERHNNASFLGDETLFLLDIHLYFRLCAVQFYSTFVFNLAQPL